MSHPHITQADRDAIEDRGLVDNDRTEKLTAPAYSGVGAPGGSRRNQPICRKASP